MAEFDLDDFRKKAKQVREVMGGEQKIAAVHARGSLTARERIAALLDPGTFTEVGTFASSPENPAGTPGDGKICGHGTVDGANVAVVSDDGTVKRGTSSAVGGAKLDRVFGQAMRGGYPFVYFGECAGGRIPDIMDSTGFVQVGPHVDLALRRRRIPMVTAIVGDSFGGSSFSAAVSDIVIQLRGTSYSVVSDRVVEAATGERTSASELGGVETNSRVTGRTDIVADTEADVLRYIKTFLQLMPANAYTRPVRTDAAENGSEAELPGLVPSSARRAYDMRRVIDRIRDAGPALELAPDYGRGLITMLTRVSGYTVGIIASQPLREAGAISPAGCDKATRLLCLCDAFSLPLIFLQDTPGFMAGREAEHGHLLEKVMLFQQALMLTKVPKVTVVIRKGFGLAYYAMCGSGMGGDFLCAWPQASIGFMAPAVGANVLGGRFGSEQISTSPFGPAGIMKVDEIIDPAETRSVICRVLGQFAQAPFAPGADRPLATWPVSW